jgi:hypothetical protein
VKDVADSLKDWLGVRDFHVDLPSEHPPAEFALFCIEMPEPLTGEDRLYMTFIRLDLSYTLHAGTKRSRRPTRRFFGTDSPLLGMHNKGEMTITVTHIF